jgi:ABC-type polysaccharide/polyol phosphate export permease
VAAPVEVDGPPAGSRFRRRVTLRAGVAELWRTREVIASLVQREIRVRYSQAILGMSWALVAPLTLMLVFTVFFDRVADIDTRGVPYPLFTYTGLLPWTFFSTAVATGGISLINNVALLNKIYCPREVFPLASVCTAGVDTLAASVALVVLFAVFGEAPAATSFWLVPLVVVLALFTVAMTLVVAAVTVYLRDLRHALALILQLGLFATPVVYDLGAIPASVRPFYVAVNPVAAVIEGVRASMLRGDAPHAGYTLIAAGVSAVWLVVAYRLFKRLETGMADVA